MANVCFHRWGRIDNPWVAKNIKGIIMCLSLDLKTLGALPPFLGQVNLHCSSPVQADRWEGGSSSHTEKEITSSEYLFILIFIK